MNLPIETENRKSNVNEDEDDEDALLDAKETL